MLVAKKVLQTILFASWCHQHKNLQPHLGTFAVVSSLFAFCALVYSQDLLADSVVQVSLSEMLSVNDWFETSVLH